LAAHKQYVKSADDGKDPQLMQALLEEAPAVMENVPAGQSVHTEAPIVEYFPAGQLRHAVAAVAPVVVMNLPAVQSTHIEAPVTILYFPATHAAHNTPLPPVNPRLQRQLVNRLVPMSDIEFNGQFMQLEDAVAPTTTEYVLTAQSMHVMDEVAPGVGEYLPAGQSVHEEPASEYAPARQFAQSANASDAEGEDLPAGQLKHVLSVVAAVPPEYLPAGQLKHLLSVVAAVVPECLPAGQSVHTEAAIVEYLPAPQSVHTEAPVTDLYFPAAHFTQSWWSSPVNPGLHTQLARPAEPLGDCEQPAPPQVAQNAQSG
jgi:hypothetical protein